VTRFAAMLLVVSATAGLGSAGATPRAPSGAAPGLVFSGYHGRVLPRFTLAEPSTLRWTSNGPALILISQDAHGGGINSTASSGATFLKPGSHLLEVNAWASWTIRIVKGIEQPRSLGGGLVGFRGNGSRSLPPFTTRRGTKLIWTNKGSLFQVDSGTLLLSISSQAKRGSRFMVSGPHELTVNASGTWTVGWKP
jgi:hypothetical protein